MTTSNPTWDTNYGFEDPTDSSSIRKDLHNDGSTSANKNMIKSGHDDDFPALIRLAPLVLPPISFTNFSYLVPSGISDNITTTF